jgi:hypothetical protein
MKTTLSPKVEKVLDILRKEFNDKVRIDIVERVLYEKDATAIPVSYTHLRAHETRHDLVCRLLLEKKK